MAASVILRRKVVSAFVLLIKLQHINSFTEFLFEKYLGTSIKQRYVLLGKVCQAIRVSLPYQYTEAPCSSFLLFTSIFHKNPSFTSLPAPQILTREQLQCLTKSAPLQGSSLHKVEGSCCAIRGCEAAGPSQDYKVMRRCT